MSHTCTHTLSSSSIGLFVWERVASDVVSTRVANVGTLIDLFRHYLVGLIKIPYSRYYSYSSVANP